MVEKSMRRIPIAGALAALLLASAPAGAQDPDRPAPPDTTESLEELEARLLGELGERDTTPGRAPAAGAAASSLNPDLSLIADFLVDLSPEEATLEEGDRFQLREIELGIQGAVDPYFRYDAFLGLHGGAIEVEEAYATTLGLPAALQARLGKFLLPFGKVNATHRPELQMFDYPLVIQEYFGEEGFSSTGVQASVIGRPLGFYQELSLVAANGMEAHGHGEEEEAHAALVPSQEEESDEDHGKSLLDDLADRLWVAHLRSSIDLSEAANLELGASWGTGTAEEEEELVRTNLYGVDAIWRWKPPARAKYRSAILQAEVMWRDEVGSGLGTRVGAFLYGQWQLGRRWYAGARLDRVERAEEEGTLRGGQLLLKVFPTEFSQLRLAYERRDPEAGEGLDRVILQTTFALGPHRPHAY
jgi:hypothetical protein